MFCRMRELKDQLGQRWTARIVSHGRTSGYLNPKVHRPLVQFACINAPLALRYAPLPVGCGDSLDGLDDAALARLLDTAKAH